MSGIKPVRAGLLGCGGFVFLIAVLVVVAARSKTEAVVTPEAAAQSPAPAPSRAPAAQKPMVVAAKIGDTVTFSDSIWSVVKVEDLGATAKSNNPFQQPLKSDGGKFIRIVMKVTNLEKQEERLLDPPKVVDDQGREFKPVDLGVFYIPQGKKTLQLEAIPPSLPKEFWEVYEVAGNSTGLRFMARELSAMGGTHPIDLGLK